MVRIVLAHSHSQSTTQQGFDAFVANYCSTTLSLSQVITAKTEDAVTACYQHYYCSFGASIGVYSFTIAMYYCHIIHQMDSVKFKCTDYCDLSRINLG